MFIPMYLLILLLDIQMYENLHKQRIVTEKAKIRVNVPQGSWVRDGFHWLVADWLITTGTLCVNISRNNSK